MPKPAPLRQRKEIIDASLEQLKEYLYIPDMGAFLILLGVIGANYFNDDPVWLLIVGSSGCGKTQMINALNAAFGEQCKFMTDVTKASFMPGTSKKDRAKDSRGGLLREMQEDNKRFLLWPEYGFITAMPGGDLLQFTNLQRAIYDGNVNKAFGTDGGLEEKWSGKIGQIGAITDNIDDVLEEDAKRGVRWMCWRYPKTDGLLEAKNSLRSRRGSNRTEDMGQIFSQVFEAAEFEWGMDVPRELTEEEESKMLRIATLASKLQGVIRREKYRPYEVVGLPSQVTPSRASKSLRSVYLSLERLGLDDAECWYQITKLAIDSASGLRVAVLNYLTHKQHAGLSPINYKQMAEDLPTGETEVHKAVEDLFKLGFLVKVPHQAGTTYQLVDQEFEILKTMYGLDEWSH